jgi:hypothetical protein
VTAALAAAGGSAAGAARLLGQVGRGGAHDPGGTVRAMMRRLGLGQAQAGARAGVSSARRRRPRSRR